MFLIPISRLSIAMQNRGGVSAFLATEIVLSFHLTVDNALIFHRFMSEFISSVKENGDLRHLRRLTFFEAYQRACSYSSSDNYAPIPVDLMQTALRVLTLLLATAGRSPCNASRTLALVKDVKREINGLLGAKLSPQRLCFNCASMGLYLPVELLGYLNDGCVQQLQNLKKAPFLFERADQVHQLKKHVMVWRPELLPMQADGIICTLSGSSSKEIVYRNHSPYYGRRERDGSIVIMRLCCRKKMLEKAPTVAFYFGVDGNHYVPRWASVINN